MRAVDVLAIHYDEATESALLLLGEQDPPQRIVPLQVSQAEAVAIALGMSRTRLSWPTTHDFLVLLLESLDAHVDRVEVTEIREGMFIAELAVSGPYGGGRIDSRPSDAIALAVRTETPVYVSDAVLAESGMVVERDESPDDDANEVSVNEEVHGFREFLADVEPSQFTTDPDDPPGGPIN